MYGLKVSISYPIFHVFDNVTPTAPLHLQHRLAGQRRWGYTNSLQQETCVTDLTMPRRRHRRRNHRRVILNQNREDRAGALRRWRSSKASGRGQQCLGDMEQVNSWHVLGKVALHVFSLEYLQSVLW